MPTCRRQGEKCCFADNTDTKQLQEGDNSALYTVKIRPRVTFRLRVKIPACENIHRRVESSLNNTTATYLPISFQGKGVLSSPFLPGTTKTMCISGLWKDTPPLTENSPMVCIYVKIATPIVKVSQSDHAAPTQRQTVGGSVGLSGKTSFTAWFTDLRCSNGT